MKKLFHNRLIRLFFLTGAWWIIIHLFAGQVHSRLGTSPEYPYYNVNTLFYGKSEVIWAAFDGAHYTRLAEKGYVDVGTQAFFPMLPFLAKTLHSQGLSYYWSFSILNLVSLLFFVWGIWRLMGQKSSFPLLATLVFPVSFFFMAFYTESFFIAISIWCFVFIKEKAYFKASILASVASATRLVGGTLILSLVLDYLVTHKKKIRLLPLLIYVVVASLGLVSYMIFLNARYGDPLMFVHVQSMFGAERSTSPNVLLPQVLYRYLKMLLTVDPLSVLYERVVLELLTFSGAFYLLFRDLKNRPASWSLYIFLSLLIPTLTGTLSSLPRYSLVIVPLLAYGVKGEKLVYLALSSTLLIQFLTLFVMGSFVA